MYIKIYGALKNQTKINEYRYLSFTRNTSKNQLAINNGLGSGKNLLFKTLTHTELVPVILNAVRCLSRNVLYFGDQFVIF